MVRAAVGVVALLGLLVGVLWLFQRHLIYFPGVGSAERVMDVVPGAEEVALTTEDGLRLGASFVAPREDDGVVVLVANGNGGDRTLRAPLARALSQRGLGVLLFDYRGYGGNEGKPTERGLAKDARAARSFLVDEADVRPERLIYFGESLGAAVVTGLAAQHPPAGLVLRSPFIDLPSVGKRHYPFLPVGLLLRDRYPLARQLRDVQAPVTVVYGGRDSVIPPEESRAVADVAPNLRRVVEVENADHNDRSLLDGDALVNAVLDLAEAVRAEPS